MEKSWSCTLKLYSVGAPAVINSVKCLIVSYAAKITLFNLFDNPYLTAPSIYPLRSIGYMTYIIYVYLIQLTTTKLTSQHI